jgi:hypothetical protein
VHALHLRKVNHHSAFANREACNAVTTSAHRHKKFLFSREIDSSHDIGSAGAADDHCRASINHPVMDLARRFVPVVTGT